MNINAKFHPILPVLCLLCITIYIQLSADDLNDNAKIRMDIYIELF